MGLQELSLTHELRQPRRRVACASGLLLALVAVASVVLCIARDSWTQARVLVTVALYVVAIPLHEYGNSGRWLPRLGAPRTAWRGVLRGFIGLGGVALLVVAAGFCAALGPGRWSVRASGLVIGLFCAALLLIRSAIAGRVQT